MPDRDRLIRALTYSSHPNAPRLQTRMQRCGSPDEWSGRFTCRTLGCDKCRGLHIRDERVAALDSFKALSNSDLALLSLVIGATPALSDIEPLFREFKKTFRNLVDARRRQRRRWADLEARLWLEVDAIHPDDFILLAPDKSTQLGELIPVFINAGKPVWVVTVHGIVAHPGLDVQEVRTALAERWGAHKQSDLKPFYDHQTVSKNIGGVVNYALKHECRVALGMVSEGWPDSWVADFYAELHSWAATYKTSRLTLGRKDPGHHRRKAQEILTVDHAMEARPLKHQGNCSEDHDLPMPIALSVIDWDYASSFRT